MTMNDLSKVRIILSGVPGVGKTTLAMYITEQILARGQKVAGFTTEEVRNPGTGKREGFDIVTLGPNGQRVPLARCGPASKAKGPKVGQYDPLARSGPASTAKGPKVGQYDVNVGEFERVALASLGKDKVKDVDVVIIDEIGKMECFSRRFQTLARAIFSSEATRVVIATGGKVPLVQELSSMAGTTVINVTKENRDTLKQDLLQMVYTEA